MAKGLLEDQIAVVTGAASERGLGRAIAQLFVQQGARVAVLDLDADRSAAAARELGEGNRGYRCDVSRRSEVESVFAAIAKDLGPAHILVANAGITQPKKIDQLSDSDFEAVLGVSLKGSFLCAQAAIPQMRQRKGGSIIFMSSVSAKRGGGIFGGPHYSAAKAGVLGLGRALARDLASENIRVNMLAPGLIDTDITGGAMTDEVRARIIADIPMGRLGRPLDIARACLFFASELSEYVTGEVMDVNGGMYID